MSNTELWDSVETTNPKHVKAITGKSYQGTSPKPHYLVRKATEKFGPCGIGWGFNIVSERIEEGAGGEKMHIAHVRLWYKWKGETGSIEHVGGTQFSGTRSSGKPFTDEDAPKKSITDALVKALSMVGFAGDIFMGRYDDSKYVNEVKAEFAEDKQEPSTPKPKETKYPLQEGERRQLWERMMNDLKGEAPKGADAMVRYMQSKETQEDLAKLEPWRQSFRKEAAELVEATRAAEGIAGEKGATIKRIKAPDFSHMTPNDVDNLEELIGPNNG